MKNLVRSAFVLLASLCSIAVAQRASATVVWTAGFEVNKSGDVCASNSAGAEFIPGAIVMTGTRIDAEVLGEQVYSGKLACKVTVHPDDIFTQSYNQNRVDVRHNSTLTGEGKDMYLSGHYYLPEDAKVRNEFGMFETTNSVNWVDIWIEPKTGGGTTINLGIESNGANLGSVPVWSGDLSIAAWHQIALHIHWSQDATKGLLDFWLDGKQVVMGFKHKTKPNANDLYYLTGMHRVVMQPYTESIYFDDFIEADTQDEIKIGAPVTIPDAGAPLGAGGAGGSSGASENPDGSGGVAAQDAGPVDSSTGAGGSAVSSPADGASGSSTSTGTDGASAAGGAAGTTTSPPPEPVRSSSGCSLSASCAPREYWASVVLMVVYWLQRRRRKRQSYSSGTAATSTWRLR